MTVDGDIGIFVNHHIDICFYQLFPLDTESSQPPSSTAPDPEVSRTFYFSRDVWLYNFLHIHDVITGFFR